MALSGGVDSSVAAALLVASGKYDVTAAFMINYDEKNPNGASCYLHDYRDAVRVAAKLGIPILKLDFKKEYSEKVLSYMYAEYEKGRTPNPDVMCNSFIKFGSWMDKAREMGFDYLATGHYARLGREIPMTKSQVPNKLQISKIKLKQSKDGNKDQTYFLHQLNQKQLSHTLFPIGGYTKPEVRKLAKKFDLQTADKEESMGICFIGEVPMKEFLQKRIAPRPGNILFDGEIIGTHEGLAFYTIGERIGVARPLPALSSAEARVDSFSPPQRREREERSHVDTRPYFIVAKNQKTNELIVGFEDDPLLYKKESAIENVNWISGQEPKFPLKCEVRLRHRQPMQVCKVKSLKSKVIVSFEKPQRAVTPGQFAVFYKKGECLGGGAIK
ncbi:MAG: tRNA 2-thiouridine(34) synthase MnmA [Patescibacteria group bacterium]